MRIAISGSHATGKSSLVSELISRLPGSISVDEPYYLLEEEGHAFATPPTSADFERCVERSIALLVTENLPSVLFDRSPADYLAYMAALRGTTVPPELIVAASAALATLDLVVFVPIERPDRVAGAEAPRLRRRVDDILREMLVDSAWGFKLPIVEVRGTVQARVSQVVAHIVTYSGRASGNE